MGKRKAHGLWVIKEGGQRTMQRCGAWSSVCDEDDGKVITGVEKEYF